jgi:hypothetical protein
VRSDEVKAAIMGFDIATAGELNFRDRAVLRAVAAGRCRMDGRSLLVDGIYCADQLVGPRLVRAGLIVSAGSGLVRLTVAGEDLLVA